MAKRDVPPRWDRKMQQRLARGEAAALGELYDRFASLVHGLAHRVLDDERAADHITRDVFAHVWEHPDAYDPRQGPLRTWIATLTHRFAVQRLRATETAALVRGGAGTAEELETKVRHASVAARADYIVQSILSSPARRAGAGLFPAPRLPPDRRRPRRHGGRGPPPPPPGPATPVHRPRQPAPPSTHRGLRPGTGVRHDGVRRER